MQKVRDFFQSYHFLDLIFVVVFILALCLRFFNYQNWQIFDYDQETALKQIRTIVVDHKPVLIGMQASVAGVFVGPLFFYVSAPFLLLGNLDPAYSLLVSFSYSIAMLFSIYYVSRKLFNRKTGLIATAIFGVSNSMIASDRTWWNPMFMPLISVWSFYFFNKYIYQKKAKYLIYSAIFIALSIHSHMSAVVIITWYFMSLGIFRAKLVLKQPLVLLFVIILFLISFLPLIIFDFRHNFLNFRSLYNFIFSSSNQFIVSGQTVVSGPTLYIDKVVNIISIIGSMIADHLEFKLSFLFGLFVLISSTINQFYETKKSSAFSFLVYVILTFVFFTFNRGSFLSYYLLYLAPILIILFSNFLSRFKTFILIPLILIAFVYNYKFSAGSPVPFSLYNKRKIVEYIKKDSKDAKFLTEFVFPDSRPIHKFGFSYLYDYYGLDFKENVINSSETKYKIAIPLSQMSIEKVDFKSGDIGVIIERPK